MADTDQVIKIDAALSGISTRQLTTALEAVEVPTMTDENKKLVDQCESMYNFSSRHKEIWMDRAKQNYLMYIGKQYDSISPLFKSIPVTNVIYAIIEYEVPLMTENRPVMKAVPRNLNDIDYAEGASKSLEYVWDDNDMTYRLPFIARNFLVLGDDFLKVYWDFTKKQIVIDPVEIDYFYPQPYVDSIEKMGYVIHAEPRPLYEIAEMFPLGKYVRPESDQTVIEELFNEETNNSNTMESIESYNAEGKTVSKEGGRSLYLHRSKIKEIWIDDKTLISEDVVLQNDQKDVIYETDAQNEYVLDENGERIPKTYIKKSRKYPYGRMVTWSNGVLLQDKGCPFKYAKPNYVHFGNVKMRRSFWSLGDPWVMISIQQQLNKRKAQIDFMADQTGNTIWIVDSDSGVEQNHITNQPGLVIWKRGGTEVRREPAPQIPDYLFTTIDDLKLEADFVSGTLSIVRGEKPGSVTAATALDALIERALVRVKEKVKYMEGSLVTLGRMIMSFVRQYWDEPKQFVIIGKGLNPETPQQIEFSGASLSEDPDIKIISGSSMAVSKSGKFEQDTVLFQLGIIDDQEFLENIEYPNYEVVLGRVAQKKQEQAQQTQQAQQQDMQLKMAEISARIKAQQIASQGRVGQETERNKGRMANTTIANMGKMNEIDKQHAATMQGKVFDMRNLLTAPGNTGGGRLVR